MRSATAFLPLSITWFMNLARIWLPYFGSARISRLAATRRLGIDKPSNGLQVSSGLGPERPRPTLLLSTRTNEKDYFGRLAPYLERPCLRSLTPVVSSEPRTV